MTGATQLPRVTLILGGARSGKSLHAERLVEGQSGACIYLATSEAGDPEMAARIREHQARRGPRWETFEEPLDLVGALGRLVTPEGAVLVDCLTLWLSNLMAADRNIDDELAALFVQKPEDRAITYCGGGVAAALDAFAMTRLGFEDVAVYAASLQEWAADPDNPMEVGPESPAQGE